MAYDRLLGIENRIAFIHQLTMIADRVYLFTFGGGATGLTFNKLSGDGVPILDDKSQLGRDLEGLEFLERYYSSSNRAVVYMLPTNSQALVKEICPKVLQFRNNIGYLVTLFDPTWGLRFVHDSVSYDLVIHGNVRGDFFFGKERIGCFNLDEESVGRLIDLIHSKGAVELTRIISGGI